MLVQTLYSEFYAEKYSKVFLWNAWNVLMRMHRKKEKYDTFFKLWVGKIKSLPLPNCLTLHTSLMDSMLISHLIEAIN